MTSLVNARFAEWTQGFDTRESMTSIFSHIRDIPYSLIFSVLDQARYYREMVAVRTPYEVKRIAQFYRDFEVWLVDVRQEKNVPSPDDTRGIFPKNNIYR
jgi:hypothetical protein